MQSVRSASLSRGELRFVVGNDDGFGQRLVGEFILS
ncbi:hypothetical protein BJ970_004406 [Saccharopolyspora phatthalungensis]|uniref:Uncharacterized protein n=1 Tax=Saccharopolyspora phatthalungensis TaxID=664693 RepID=A0A840Q2X5_9PSEU|nr:hypothetical protein [Saccharopolyspora phatthalungensis]